MTLRHAALWLSVFAFGSQAGADEIRLVKNGGITDQPYTFAERLILASSIFPQNLFSLCLKLKSHLLRYAHVPSG